MIEARIIEDSISQQGRRLTTFEVTFPRFILAEVNTHRLLSRNSSSSRAIPVETQLEKFTKDPATPEDWLAEKPGMGAGAPLENNPREDAIQLWSEMVNLVSYRLEGYLADHPDKAERLHKSYLNRWLEPAMWHRAIITATDWEAYFDQRSLLRTPDAQPEFGVLAAKMEAEWRGSIPALLREGEWHLPYVEPEERLHLPFREQRACAVARCTRVSRENHGGGKSTPEQDWELYAKLVTQSPPHASPLEHVATPASWNILETDLNGLNDEHWHFTTPRIGNFTGWVQLRHLELGL